VGELVMTIGREPDAAPKWSGRPFNGPTNVAISPNTGDVFITDGYCNAGVHRYAPDGQHIVSWGDAGVAPGEFQIPHNVVVDRDETSTLPIERTPASRCSTEMATCNTSGATSTAPRPYAWALTGPSTSAKC